MSSPAAAPDRANPVRRLRGRDIHEAHRTATSLELLLDLTFVVAISLAASQLHHGVMAHHMPQALIGYLLAFGAIWWAWMNYTWFASAYDDDSVLFRTLTMVQMGGVLVLATGIPALSEGSFVGSVTGYVVMRLALCTQWLLAARGDPLRRRTCVRYALGVALVQIGWVLFLLAVTNSVLTGAGVFVVMIVLWLCELAVPAWAESAGATPWHAHHIAERYAGMVIIVLGECVLGATNAIAGVWQTHGWTFNLALVGFAGTLLIFCLWWMYFLLPSADVLHQHRERAWVWGYGHFLLFASCAAIGSGLEVVADVLKATQAAATGQLASTTSGAAESAHMVSPLYAITLTAAAEAAFAISLWALHRHLARAQDRQMLLTLVCLICMALGPLAVYLGLSLAWGLLLLSLGPIIAVAYNEHGRRHCPASFEVR